MSKISKEFIQRIAKDKLDDFLYYTEPSPNDVLYGVKQHVTIKGFIIKQDLQNPENLYDNIMYITNDNQYTITSAYIDGDTFIVVTINTTQYILYYKNNYYYIKHDSKCYKFRDENHYLEIFTCIAILHLKPDYSNILKRIIYVNFDMRCDKYIPAIYHILDGYLSRKADGYLSYKIDNYLIDRLHRLGIVMIHFITELWDYIIVLTTNLNHINIKDVLTLDFRSGEFSVELLFKEGHSYIFSCGMVTNFGGHAISVVIHYTNNIYRVFIVNSGYDFESLENSKSIIKDKLHYHRPFSCHKTKDKQQIGKLIFFIYFLNSLRYTQFKIENHLYQKVILFDDITEDILNFSIIENTNTYKVSYDNISYYTVILNRILKDTYDNDFLNTSIESVTLDSDITNESFNHSINEDIQYKLQFHSITEDNISSIRPPTHNLMGGTPDNYTKMLSISQQQGTCTWFCKYWSLVLISLIKGKYSDFIKNMYKICIRDLTRLLYTDFIDYEFDYMISIKMLLSKLNNLNILKPKKPIQYYDLIDKTGDIVKFKLSQDIRQKSILDKITNMGILIHFLSSDKYEKTNYLQIFKKIIESKAFLEKELVKITIINRETFANILSDKNIDTIMYGLKFYNNSIDIISKLEVDQIYLHNIKVYYLLSYLQIAYNHDTIKYYMILSYYFYVIIIIIITIRVSGKVYETKDFVKQVINNINLRDCNTVLYLKFLQFFVSLQTLENYDFIEYDNFFEYKPVKLNVWNIDRHFIDNIDHIISIENVNKQREILLNNPILVFNKFENKDTLEYYSVFFILNINYINENPEIKTKLIKFFLSLYYTKKSIKITIISLIHLQILYCGSISYLGIHMFDNDASLKEICDITNTFFTKESSMNISFLKLLLDEYLVKYKTVEEFIHKVNEILSVTDKTESDKTESDKQMVSMLKKHHNISTEITDDMIIDKSYDNTFIKLLFGISNDIYVIKSSDGNFIYMISLEYYIKIVFEDDIIKEIYYNGNRVLKPSDIELPFINILPVAGFYLFYKKDDKFYVVSFIHNNLQLTGDKNFLDPMRFKSRVLTIPISSVNRYYPGTPEGWKNLDYIIEAYGYNKLNFFLVRAETNNGYVITENEMNNVKKNYLTFNFSDSVNIVSDESDESDIPFNFSEDILDIKQLRSHPKKLIYIARSLLKIGQITKSEYSIMINDNMEMLNGDIVEIYESYNKLSHKVNKLSLKTLPNSSEGYISETGNLMTSLKDLDTFTELKKKILTYMSYIRYIKTDSLLQSLFTDLDSDLDSESESKKDYKKSLLASNMDLFKSRKHKYEYFFEYFFEFIFGSPTEEQFQIYKKITGNYDSSVKGKYQKMITTSTSSGRFKLVKKDMYGGEMVSLDDALTTIQHFMMGKGKSSVLTPLLTMYFVLNHNKTVYIVVPEHLKKQTLKTMEPYIKIFGMDTVKIVTNIELYVLFLNEEIETGSIFLIDEIDSLVDPLKSNFNLIQTYKDSSIVTDLYDIIKSFSEQIDDTNLSDRNKMLYHDVKHYEENLSNGILKYNINWGIHPTKAYAIPFINKDKPALDSTFSSIVLTLFLTYYYYYDKIAPKDNKLPSILKAYIRHNKLNYKYKLNKIDLTDEDLDTLHDNKYEIIKDVTLTIQMTNEQVNISFVDLLLKDDVYKIGYSGTVNVKFPKVENSVKYEIYEDKDEIVNIAYALSQAKILRSSESNISKYDAYIDICGHFKDKKNEEQSRKFKVEGKAIIFIDEYDNVKYIGTDDKALPYSDNLTLDKPKIYFDQGHTVGIDIKQDRYPYMKALCYVSLNSKYSDVAQGLYRMRKLNAGQTVDLFLVDPIQDEPEMTISQLYKCFRNNQTKYVLTSEPLLNFQTVKALVRKKSLKTRMVAHLEKVKYYFEGFYGNILEGILEGDHTEHLTKYRLETEKLEEFVYNRKSDSQQTQQQKQQVHQEQHTNAIYMTKYKYDKYQSNIRYSDTEVMNKILNWSITNKCSDNVYFLDDIFDKYENKNGFCFVKLDDKDDLLLICAKHSIYFSDKPLYTLYLEPLNGGIQIFDKLKEKDMFIKAIFSMADKISEESDEFKVVLYTVLFTLKSEIPTHLRYMTDLTVPDNIEFIFKKYDKYDYKNMDIDKIKEISNKIVDAGKVIIYYIRSLKFEEDTVYYYVKMENDLLLIDDSVKEHFETALIIDDFDESKYNNNSFVNIINQKYNIIKNGKKFLESGTHLNTLTYLVLICKKNRLYQYDQNLINKLYTKLLTYQKESNDHYYDTRIITN